MKQEMLNGDLIQPLIHEDSLQQIRFQYRGNASIKSHCALLDQLHDERCGR